MHLSTLITFLQKILLTTAFLVYLYWTWNLGKLWGFRKEKVLDLALIAPAAGLITYYLFDRLGFRSESFFLLGWLVFVVYFSEKLIWSRLKIGDIFSLSLTAASIFYPYYPSPLFNLLSAGAVYFLYRVYKIKPKSGFVFFTFLVMFSLYLFAFSFWRYHNLLTINSALSTGCLFFSIIFLKKKEYHESMDLLKYSLPTDVLDLLRKRLLDKKKVLDENVSTMIPWETKNDPVEKSADEQDQASNQREREINESVFGSVNQSQKDVDIALKKIEQGSYGLCEKCGKPIGKDRLEIYPETRFCVLHAPEE